MKSVFMTCELTSPLVPDGPTWFLIEWPMPRASMPKIAGVYSTLREAEKAAEAWRMVDGMTQPDTLTAALQAFRDHPSSSPAYDLASEIRKAVRAEIGGARDPSNEPMRPVALIDLRCEGCHRTLRATVIHPSILRGFVCKCGHETTLREPLPKWRDLRPGESWT